MTHAVSTRIENLGEKITLFSYSRPWQIYSAISKLPEEKGCFACITTFMLFQSGSILQFQVGRTEKGCCAYVTYTTINGSILQFFD